MLVFTDAMNFDSSTGKKLGRFHEMSHLNVKKVDTAHLFMENKVYWLHHYDEPGNSSVFERAAGRNTGA